MTPGVDCADCYLYEPDGFLFGIVITLPGVALVAGVIYVLKALLAIALISGAAYGVVVFGSGGHSRSFWSGVHRHVVRWRRRWLALAMNSYLFGIFSLSALAAPNPTWLALDVVLLLCGVVGTDRATEGGRVPGFARWSGPAAMAALLGIGWGMGAATFAALLGTSAVTAAVLACLWSISACLTALEVWHIGAPLRSTASRTTVVAA